MIKKTQEPASTTNIVTVAEGVLDTPEKLKDFHAFLARAGREARDKYAQARRDTDAAAPFTRIG